MSVTLSMFDLATLIAVGLVLSLSAWVLGLAMGQRFK